MEKELFNQIRLEFTNSEPQVKPGKMMSSEAITYKDKVFAFISRKNKMVFKLGKGFDPDTADIEMNVFSPFKNKKPLSGWFEIDYQYNDHWKPYTEKALNLIKQEIK